MQNIYELQSNDEMNEMILAVCKQLLVCTNIIFLYVCNSILSTLLPFCSPFGNIQNYSTTRFKPPFIKGIQCGRVLKVICAEGALYNVHVWGYVTR